MKRWWARNPWKGLAFKERRRLERLSRSGQPINDPQDNQRVRDYVVYMNRLYRTRSWKFGVVVVLLLVMPSFAVGMVVRAIQGNVVHSAWDGFWLLAYLSLVLQMRSHRRNMGRTAGANGWAESPP